MSVVQLAQQILAYISVLLGQVGAIYQAIVGQQITITIHDTAAEVSQTLATVTDPTYGNAPIQLQIVSMQAQITTLLADVVALGTPQQAGSPVTLPTSAPSGYGGATASQVWSFVPASQAKTTASLLEIAGWLPVRLEAIGAVIPSSEWPFIGFAGSWDEPTFGDPNFNNIPYIDPATIIAADTSTLVWLNRAYPGVGWYDSGGGMVQAVSNDGQNIAGVLIDPFQFTLMRAWAVSGSLGGAAKPAAPIWPGIANVTYGDDQSMDAPTGSLSGPADGYKIVIDATPSWAGTYAFDVRTSFRNVGAIAFVDDEGVPEFPQTLGLDQVIYLPKSMTGSVGAYYRLNLGYHCVATPFTINS